MNLEYIPHLITFLHDLTFLQPPPKESLLRVLILSLPSTSRRLRLSNVFINTLLIAAAADFVVTPFLDTASDVVFTRIGAVHPDSVKIVARYPEFNSTGQTNRRLIYRETTSLALESWKDGPIMTFAEDRDWVDTVKLTGLWPNTSYECKQLSSLLLYINFISPLQMLSLI